MTPEQVPLEVWADEGSRAAPALTDVAAAIVTGRDPEAAAAVALGLARTHARERRVAIADLVGGIPALTPLADQPGLLECLRDGEPVSGIGQPVPGDENIYVLPSGNGPIAERWVFESARWERLIAGFREVDALLLLVTPPHAPGLATLLNRVDGVVAVDLPPRDLQTFPLLATIDHPEPELPPIAVHRTSPQGSATIPGPRRPRRIGRYLVLAVAVVAAAGLWWQTRAAAPEAADADTAAAAPAGTAATAGSSSGEADDAPGTPAVEVTLGPPVNPSDSLRRVDFAVELVAANTPASANSSFALPSGVPPVPTVSPVVLGTATRPWYRALIGAWTDRQAAEAWLEAHRATGEVRETAGRVVAVPYALLLADSLAPSEAEAALVQWERIVGLRPYALRQEDGRVRIYAGAFETVGQAGWLASTLRDAGVTPRLAYRTGRAF